MIFKTTKGNDDDEKRESGQHITKRTTSILKIRKENPRLKKVLNDFLSTASQYSQYQQLTAY
jgi:hypothetical protein